MRAALISFHARLRRTRVEAHTPRNFPMKSFRSFTPASPCILLLLAAFPALAENPKNIHPSGYVTDLASVITPDTKARLEALCHEVEAKSGAQIAVVTVHSLEGESVENFAVDLYKQLGVGSKRDNRGVLLLVAPDEHKYRIEVGYGLEPVINDARAGDAGRAMVPLLRQGDYSAAIEAATWMLAKYIADDRGVTLSGRPPATRQRREARRSSPIGFWAILFIIWIIFSIARAGRGRRGGGGGWWIGPMLGGMGGGWRGGGFGGSSGGFSGGGGFGGFGGGSSGSGGGQSRVDHFVRVGGARRFSRRAFGFEYSLHLALAVRSRVGACLRSGEVVDHRAPSTRATFLWCRRASAVRGRFRHRAPGHAAEPSGAVRGRRHRRHYRPDELASRSGGARVAHAVAEVAAASSARGGKSAGAGGRFGQIVFEHA